MGGGGGFEPGGFGTVFRRRAGVGEAWPGAIVSTGMLDDLPGEYVPLTMYIGKYI
jgi:hypothetical protein